MPAKNHAAFESPVERNFIIYLAALIGGILAVIVIALPLEFFFDVPAPLAGIIEEPAKLIGLFLIVLCLPDWLRSKKTCAIGGALAGVGFAFAENFWYYVLSAVFQEFAPELVFGRTVFSLPSHVLVSAIAGMGVLYIAAKGRQWYAGFLSLLVVAIILHGLWNSGATIGWYLVVLVLDIAAFGVIYAKLPDYPLPDDEVGILTLPTRDVWITRDRTFGRGDFKNEVRLSELPHISKTQFRILKRGTQFCLEDCSGKGLVKLNGTEIKGHQRLSGGNIIDLPAGLRLRFETKATMERVMDMQTSVGAIKPVVIRAGFPRHSQLVIQNGGAVELREPHTELGRASLSSKLSAERLQRISRRHFAITMTDAGCYIEDLGSTNGTFVNGQAIQGKGRVLLVSNDEIEIPNALKMTYVETIMPQ
jgi:pSer/pThr/pTyr-binding forkhead associated (FHA) protein